MEFLLFLSAKEKEILNIIQRAEYSVEENTPLCLLGNQYFGFFKRNQKRVVICTSNAKIKGGYFIPSVDSDDINKTAIYIRRALRHESVHIAQHCNNGNLIEMKKNLKIHPYKIEALKGSTRISGKKDHEYQAYTLEDRPKLIIKALKKYCL
tara:strand:- start:35065 stop:35520 length:456 start_codon:yes stop_codon:yes gene_type:complete